ncbi:LADA_0A03642g1_1 [Lachancea dasiensis]|uniref:LADA_0A03642g1_1 n=1 Tax=Lachancea dasiensis TaxID=1072105 RepID=A0A1G4IN17_9SACH|nr:LADA_0A03642g1_1 [Lachancea dasiensis]
MPEKPPPVGARKRTQEHWEKFEYRKKSKVNNEQSDSVDQVKRSPNIIDLTSDNDSPEETSTTDVSYIEPIHSSADEADQKLPSSSNENQETTAPFRLIKSDIYDSNRASQHFITLEEIFGDRSIAKSWLFSFQYELDYILPMFPLHAEITIVAQNGTILPVSQPNSKVLTLLARLKTLLVNLPPYSCHHSKMVINLYNNGDCQLFIPSNNFTSAETNLPTQIVWSSPRLKSSSCESSSSAFKDSLLTYLKGYEINLKPLVAVLETVDFLPLDDSGSQFVYSHPKVAGCGLSQLSTLLRDKKHTHLIDQSTHHYLCQTSTIGSPIKAGLRSPGNLFTHYMIPLFSGLLDPKTNAKANPGRKANEIPNLKERFDTNHIKPYIVYPTAQELQKSAMGYLAGGWFHYHWLRNQVSQDVHQLLRSWGVFHKRQTHTTDARKATPSHTKFYMKSTGTCLTDSKRSPLRTPEWVLYTTANLSLNAWGTLTSKPRNYEVGVLFKSSEDNAIELQSVTDLVYSPFIGTGETIGDGKPEFLKRKKTLVMVPFDIPPKPYGELDDSFCISRNYVEPDSLGRYHQPQG